MAVTTSGDVADEAGSEGAASEVPLAAVAPTAPVIPLRPSAPMPGVSTLDTSRIDWIETLVDRIDDARGAGGHRSAQIRLLPDALGMVDVRIQHDGDRVTVNIVADNPQARAMLAEGAPRLVELAESRGLKLGDPSADQGRHGQRSEQQQSAPPRTPRPASTPPETAPDDMSERLA